jgi:hypothetical protein
MDYILLVQATVAQATVQQAVMLLPLQLLAMLLEGKQVCGTADNMWYGR